MSGASTIAGIKSLMHECKGLPADMSATKISHYAMELVKRIERGETASELERYIRRIKAPGRAQVHVSAATRELAELAFALVHKGS